MSAKPTPKPRPTSIDVARAAGVSQSSVSLVFNNVGGSRVSPETRERILKAAQDLGYQPDRAASALRKGYGDEIAFLSADFPYSIPTAQGFAAIQERAQELGYSLGLYLCHHLSEDARRNLFASIIARRPVGIISLTQLLTPEDIRYAKKMGVQAILLQGFEPKKYATTQIFPLKQVFHTAASHLVERGHRQIARAVPRTLSAVEESTRKLIRDSIASVVHAAGGTVVDVPMDLEYPDACTAVETLLSLPTPPTAILGNRDEYCFYLLKALSARGIRVPQEIALVGVGNSPFCDLSQPTLTSVDYDIPRFSSHSVDVIDALLKGNEPGPELLAPVPPQLIVREST